MKLNSSISLNVFVQKAHERVKTFLLLCLFDTYSVSEHNNERTIAEYIKTDNRDYLPVDGGKTPLVCDKDLSFFKVIKIPMADAT